MEIENDSKYAVVRLPLLRTEIFEDKDHGESCIDVSGVKEYLESKRLPEYRYEYSKPNMLFSKKKYKTALESVDKANWAFASIYGYYTENPEDDYYYKMDIFENWSEVDGINKQRGCLKSDWLDAVDEYLKSLNQKETAEDIDLWSI